MKLEVRRGCTVPSPLSWPSTKKSDGTKEFATTDSMDCCNVLQETQFVGTRLRVDTHGFICEGFPSPLGSCRREVLVWHQTAFRGSTPDFSTRLSPEVYSTSGYFRKTAGVCNQSFPSPRWAAKGYRATPARLPVILLATRSQHFIFAYDQVVRPHRSYRPSGGHPRGKPRTCGFAAIDGARGVDNGGVRATAMINGLINIDMVMITICIQSLYGKWLLWKIKLDIHASKITNRPLKDVFGVKNVKQLQINHRDGMIVSAFGGGLRKPKKCSVLCCRIINISTTTNDVRLLSMFLMNVMLPHKVYFNIVAIQPPRVRDWRGNDISTNPLGRNATVFVRHFSTKPCFIDKNDVRVIAFYIC